MKHKKLKVAILSQHFAEYMTLLAQEIAKFCEVLKLLENESL
jgi:hypothetical protein